MHICTHMHIAYVLSSGGGAEVSSFEGQACSFSHRSLFFPLRHISFFYFIYCLISSNWHVGNLSFLKRFVCLLLAPCVSQYFPLKCLPLRIKAVTDLNAVLCLRVKFHSHEAFDHPETSHSYPLYIYLCSVIWVLIYLYSLSIHFEWEFSFFFYLQFFLISFSSTKKLAEVKIFFSFLGVSRQCLTLVF